MPRMTSKELYDSICIAIGCIELRGYREFRDCSVDITTEVRRALFSPENRHMNSVAEDWRRSARAVICVLQQANALRDEFKDLPEQGVTRAQYWPTR
jgi:hypothetical protein